MQKEIVLRTIFADHNQKYNPMENKNHQAKIIIHPASLDELLRRRNVISVRPYMLKELAHLYGVSGRTVKNWIRPFKSEVGIKTGRYYSIRQVRTIFDNLGVPYVLELDMAEAA